MPHIPDTSSVPMVKCSKPLNGTTDEILIRGKYYEVSEFKKHHPGGGIINFYLGQDATEAFNAFHARSTRVQKYLATVPTRDGRVSGGSQLATATVINSYQETDPLVADFEKLRLELYREGFFNPSLGHVTYRLLELLAMHAVGVQLIWNGWWVTGVFILGIALGRCGWVQHEAGHYSLTGNMTVDRILQELVFGIGLGMSAAYWRNQHNKHHAMPQKLKHDVDLQTLPLVAFNAEIAKDGRVGWLRWQAFAFIPIIQFLVGMVFTLYLHPRHSLRARRLVELFYYFLRYALIFGFVLHGYPFTQQLYAVLAYEWVGGIYLLTNFSLSHTHRPVIGAAEHLDWIRFAANHTVDIEHMLWCNWWMGYLNYQIEHHLFPTMPQFRNRAVVPRVRSLLEKHGVPYVVLSYWEALRVTLLNLHTVGQSGIVTPHTRKSSKQN